ncbi:sigma-70 family RNA polymerase sigma factor [Blastopirellula retiformator]|nr:sigma-70 family RNA polymerase sigma factor [Blastopirellula retiformator]
MSKNLPVNNADPTTFVELIVKHERPLMRYIRCMIPHLADAEEIYQSTAILLWEKFAEYDPQRDFLPWAQRFAYFEILKFRRNAARRRMIFSEETLQAIADTHSASSTTLERRNRALQACLQKLPPGERNLLRSRYESRETIGAVAEELKITAKSLYRRLDRIREKLSQCVRHHAKLLEE